MIEAPEEPAKIGLVHVTRARRLHQRAQAKEMLLDLPLATLVGGQRASETCVEMNFGWKTGLDLRSIISIGWSTLSICSCGNQAYRARSFWDEVVV